MEIQTICKAQVTIGINRFPYDSLTLKEGYGLDGFNSTALSGNRRLFSLCRLNHMPHGIFSDSVLGPILLIHLECLAMMQQDLKHSKVYSQIGLGVLIKNENLVFNTFQISISFYPLIPGIGQDVFKMNSYRTTDFGFRDFEIGKPGMIQYQ